MVCTGFISNIDSTVNNFQEGEEKETARKIQSQLLAAISQFAAADVYPASPSFRNPSKLKHSIEELKALTQKKTFQVAVPLVTPTTKPTLKKIPAPKHPLPKIPQVQGDSWVKLVRNGHKKSRATKESVELKESNARAQGSVTPSGLSIDKNQSSLNTEDKRLFIRLSQDHEWRNLSPAGIREVIVRKLSISPTCIKFIKPVRSGFALSPCNIQAREALFQSAIRLSSLNVKLESATNWTPVIIPTVPKTICTTEGRLEVTKSILGDEVERVTRTRPRALKLYGHSQHEAPHRTWMAFFTKAPRPGFRVFDESGIMRNYKRKHAGDRDYQAVARARAAEAEAKVKAAADTVSTLENTEDIMYYGQGNEIEKWADENRLLCLIIGEPTHRAGNTLDLAWTKISEITAWVDRDECMTSDHLPISGIVPSQFHPTAPPKKMLKVPNESLPYFAHVVSRWILPITYLNSTDDLEVFAEDLCRALADGIKAVGKRSSEGKGKSAPW
ncbi:putative eka-like protein [Erysiphe necator]|uniref:Putative eka-like protein n=1 Tax=Uncinula necator TaxID=52586 RepID=A0A0B1P5N6_UNCNE|nr:putative eka-like protein [Erysiphe necator]